MAFNPYPVGDVTDPYADCGDTCGTFDETDPYNVDTYTSSDLFGDCGEVCNDPDYYTSVGFTPTTGNISLVDAAWTDNVGSATYGRFVGVDLYGKAYYSDDGGTNWTRNDVPNNATYNSKQIVYANGIFMTLGENFYRSVDGLSWTDVTPNASLMWKNSLGYDVYRSAWVTTGRTPGGTYASFKSTDNGSNWTEITGGVGSYFYAGIAARSNILISFASNYQVGYYSTDLNSTSLYYGGVTDVWSIVSSQYRSEAYNCNGNIVYANAYTDDGYNWYDVSPSGLLLTTFTYLSDFNLYLATSRLNANDYYLQTSSDGITWTEAQWVSAPAGGWTKGKLCASTDRVIGCEYTQSIIIAVAAGI